MPSARPNVLFLPIDDLRPQLGCYGHPQMVTPHIDALAESGVTFTRAYCQVPVCGATRASLMTGVRPLRDRFRTFHARVDEDLPGARTLPQHFREHGYETVSLGKVFHHLEDTAERSWSRPPWHPNQLRQTNWRDYAVEDNARTAALHNGRGPSYESADVPDDRYFDGQTTDKALGELDRLAAQDGPFFLAAGFIKPHLPFNAPTRYWDYYRHDQVDLADNPYAPAGAPSQALHNWGELRQYVGIPEEGPLPEELDRNLVHGYYAATSYMDAQVGRVLDRLDTLGLAENTIVVLWGDHGWQLGEHGLWCKHCNFNTSLQAPLVIRAPGLERGRDCRGLVEFADVFPTLCDLAGLPQPDGMEGGPLTSLLEDPGRPGKSAVFSRYMSGDSVRTDRFLYTEWSTDQGDRTARMLYDHDADPGENLNLSEAPEHAGTVAELATALHEGWQAVGQG